ncbi:LysR family transcriptional regulator [Microbispora sp. ATCC PTA-5024]|uniref:LysR family transcriptional regulator n=1 Tax=Microbispora sp. ATCC PTA-5024 TaxID=316330 RepID=UPI0003DD8B54|nr:LysR family transcriptional regulator [Microbispora sp. ATCC PTA-5024]ETK36079.1 LysR family transcriptional regulator [Microbispora sp. ATCC PTA-5024]
MELRQLRVFDAVVTHGTVTEAAVRLGLAPSSVSQQIRTLERSLGVALFGRGPRGMRLTEAGERLLPWARTLLDQAERARADVADGPAVLRLGALETIAATHVPGVLARLALRRPELRVEVRASTSRDELLSAVAAGDLDAALLLDRGASLGGLGFVPPPAGTDLEFVDLEPVPLALVAAPGHRLDGAQRVTPADLRGERLLVNVPSCSFRIAADRLLGPHVERVPAGGVPVMRAWAERGLGVALLPEFAVGDRVASGALTRLPIDAPELELRLVWRAGRETRAGVRQLLYAASAPPEGP